MAFPSFIAYIIDTKVTCYCTKPMQTQTIEPSRFMLMAGGSSLRNLVPKAYTVLKCTLLVQIEYIATRPLTKSVGGQTVPLKGGHR